tara:strand:- start:513 stop:1319 length:807 start_codon:yes stop_codon:yes gene_type:complete
MNKQEEQTLRENIRHLIKYVKTKNQQEKDLFRESLKTLAKLELSHMLTERDVADTDPTPNKSTGINVLEDLLRKIIPVLEPDYKSLTTNDEQRESFRAHIVSAIVTTLTPVEVNDEAGDMEAAEMNLEEEIDIDIGGEAGADEDKFIDIRTDAEKKAEEDETTPDPRSEFGIEGKDETGRNMAYNTFNKIETSIIDSYELLSNPEDQELFYDYLIANVKLYFDKFEDALAPDVEEPTNQAYDMAKSEQSSAVDGAVEEFALQEMAIDL